MVCGLGITAADLRSDQSRADLPFAKSLDQAMAAVVDDAAFVEAHAADPNPPFRLPFPKPATTKIINHNDLSVRYPRAQEAAAAVTHTARWIRLYTALDDPCSQGRTRLRLGPRLRSTPWLRRRAWGPLAG